MDVIFNAIVNHVELAVAGVWAGILHKGLGYAAITVLVGLAFGSQMLGGIPVVGPWLVKFFAPLRKDLLWAAFGVALILGGEYIGAHDEAAKCVAKTVVIEKVVDKAVTKATGKTTKTWRDPYDNPNN